jgi:hypothetical protein
MLTAGNEVIDLYTEFTQMRRAGRSRDEAWLGIERAVSTLSQAELNQLLSMLRSWEAKDGQQYPSERVSNTHDTSLKPPPNRDDLIQTRVIRRLETAAPTRQAIPKVACPSCGKPNSEHDIYCYSCGTVMMQPGGTRQIGTDEADVTNVQDDVVFGEDMLLYLRVFGSTKAIRVRPRKDEMVIGRASPDSVMLPDIDLAPFDALNKGVSRLHAGLRRQGETLVLTDLGSRNHSYINGQRLHPQEVRVLRNGDELRFGQLNLRVYFKTD